MEYEYYPGSEFLDAMLDWDEPDEREELIQKIMVTMELFPTEHVESEDGFLSLLENACYICNVELDSLSQKELNWLRENMEQA